MRIIVDVPIDFIMNELLILQMRLDFLEELELSDRLKKLEAEVNRLKMDKEGHEQID